MGLKSTWCLAIPLYHQSLFCMLTSYCTFSSLHLYHMFLVPFIPACLIFLVDASSNLVASDPMESILPFKKGRFIGKDGPPPSIEKKSSDTEELIQVLREQAAWRQGISGLSRGTFSSLFWTFSSFTEHMFPCL